MSNKARNSNDSILVDTKELLKVLDEAIKRMTKMYRVHGAALRMEDAGFDIIHHFTVAKNCPEVRNEEIRRMFGAYGRLIAAFEILQTAKVDTQKSSDYHNEEKMSLLSDTCKITMAQYIDKIEEGVRKWHNSMKESSSRSAVGRPVAGQEDGRQYV